MIIVPKILIFIILIIQSQAQEFGNLEIGEIKEDIAKGNTTNIKDLKLNEEISIENSSNIIQHEIIQQFATEQNLNQEELKENLTQIIIISTENLNINTTEAKTHQENVKEREELEKVSPKGKIEHKEVNSVDIKKDENQQDNKEIFLNSSDSSAEDETTVITTTETIAIVKPLISLEEYALKQMNFILDYLLIETQDFVAKVLQASVNTVFQRDNLKRYAEGLNRLLNPDTDSDYSDEILVEARNLTQEEIYEEIQLKLNFLKSRPSRYLQRQLPPDWIRDYRNKKAEMIIWLDKASEQMHREFNRYVSQEDDHIKYQYFNEAFDDISRATEIRHKLALLADLVKIVKNKKKITFMDLYMQR